MKILTLTLALLLTLFISTIQFTSSQYLPKQYIIATNKARKAAKVPLVKWNATLAIYASRVARGCGRRPRIPKYGLNVFVGSITINATGCVGTWAGQSRCFNPKTRRCRRHCRCRSYRRMISRRVKYMGCGRRTCSRKRECIVCAYWPYRRHSEEFNEGVEFYDEEETYSSGDMEDEYLSEFNGGEEAEVNDAEEEEYLRDEEELELSGGEEVENDTEEEISGEKVEEEEVMENDSSSGVVSKLGAYLLWG